MRAPALPFLPARQSVARTSSFLSYTTVTASATAHTKGAYAELVASTPFDVEWMVLSCSNVGVSATATSMLLDLAIGPGGSEQVILADLNIASAGNWNVTDTLPNVVFLPLRVPAGVRIAARVQSQIASDTAQVSVDLYGGSPFPGLSSFAACDTYGANTAASRGTTVTPGASGAEGAWTQVVAATSSDVHALFLSLGYNSVAAVNARNTLWDIGAGPGGSEVQIVEGIPLGHANVELLVMDALGIRSFVDLNLPTGTRLAVRAANSGTTTNYDVCLHALRR